MSQNLLANKLKARILYSNGHYRGKQSIVRVVKQIIDKKKEVTVSKGVAVTLAIVSILLGLKGAVWIYDEMEQTIMGVDALDPLDREIVNRKAIQTLRIGDTLETVSEKMGTADFNEIKAFTDNTFQVLYFRTQLVKEDGITTRDECTPLVFENSNLIGWGPDFVKYAFSKAANADTEETFVSN